MRQLIFAGGPMAYKAPVADILFTLNNVAGFSRHLEDGVFGDLDAATVEAILEEAGKFASEELSAINRSGDEVGAVLKDGEVTLPPGWKEAYRRFWEGGWNSLPLPEDYGGQGLPVTLSMAVTEMWNGANMAFSLNPLLTQAGVEALHKYGSEALKEKYLPKMVSGEWTGSMQLTEPHAGSDLRFLKTRAVPQGDGTYRITGTKIFITFGEHQLTDNIVHIVLARLPDAPEGTKGISMFLIPKFLVGDDGSLGARNDVRAAKLEHKLGIHGSPTCVLNYGDQGGAVGWLVGEPHEGLFYMFTMMNQARLGVGVQGVGLAEHAYQDALAYARDRKQGSIEGTPPSEMTPIINHPDVRRMLMSMKAKVAAARAICSMNAVAIDLARRDRDEAGRARADALAALLTPISKSYGSDIAVEVASEGIQVHGGMGFIEETGAAQHYRDARIAPIYEGTNGIQALDLVSRKLPMQKGEFVKGFIADLKETVQEAKASNEPAFGAMADCLAESIADLEETSNWLLGKLAENRDAAFAGATPYSRIFALATGGAYLARGALAAARGGSGSDAAADTHIAVARHFAETQAPLTGGLKRTVFHSHETVLGPLADAALG
jgi:alkylation response protein AidB-like acyl-CoA dehydrogenase